MAKKNETYLCMDCGSRILGREEFEAHKKVCPKGKK